MNSTTQETEWLALASAAVWYDRDSNSIRSAIDGDVVTLGPAYNASRTVSYLVIMTQKEFSLKEDQSTVAMVEMVLATLVLFLCLMPLVLVYAAFTVVVSRLTRYGSTTSFAELSAHEGQKMDLAMTATPIIPTILVGYFWHSRFCYDLLMAPLVFPYQEIFRWVWFIAMMMFVFMITRLERKTRRTVVNRTIAEEDKGQGIAGTGNSTQPEET